MRKRKLLSIILSLAMIFSIVSVGAVNVNAAEDAAVVEVQADDAVPEAS